MQQLTEADFNQMISMCRLPQCLDVVTVEKVSQSQKKKLIRFQNNAFLVLYNNKTKVIKILSTLPLSAFPAGPKITRNKKRHRNHTKFRLKQRLNLDVSDAELKQMARMCHTKYQHIKISQRAPGRTKNLIHYKNTDIVAVYEDCSDSIVTVMPTSYLKEAERDWLFCSKRVRYKQMLKHTKEQSNVTR